MVVGLLRQLTLELVPGQDLTLKMIPSPVPRRWIAGQGRKNTPMTSRTKRPRDPHHPTQCSDGSFTPLAIHDPRSQGRVSQGCLDGRSDFVGVDGASQPVALDHLGLLAWLLWSALNRSS